MEDVLKKLLDSKIISGLTIGVIGSIVSIVIMLLNSVFELPLYIMMGVFFVFSVIVIIFTVKPPKQPEHELNIILSRHNTTVENVDYLLTKLKDKNIDNILKYIKLQDARKHLLNHKFFGSDGCIKWERSIRLIQNNPNIDLGKKWCVVKWLSVKLDTVVCVVKEFIKYHNNDIMDNNIDFGLDLMVSAIYDSIDRNNVGCNPYEILGYNCKLLQMGFKNEVLSDYSNVHEYIVKKLVSKINKLKDIDYIVSDYTKYMMLLDILYDTMDYTYSDGHLQEILKINGRLNPIYETIKEKVSCGILKW